MDTRLIAFINHIGKMNGQSSVLLDAFICLQIVSKSGFLFLFRCLRGQVPYGRGRDSVVVSFRNYVCVLI